MIAAETELAAALRERRLVIADDLSRRTGEQHLRRLEEISRRIERLAAALPRPAPPQLEHYLERCSYDKALEFLEARAAPRS